MASLEVWTVEEARRHPKLLRLGYFGSYARGDWSVGSDLDLVAILEHCDADFAHRGLSWSTETLPVPTDLLVYTQQEWEQLQRSGGRFARTLAEETVWTFER